MKQIIVAALLASAASIAAHAKDLCPITTTAISLEDADSVIANCKVDKHATLSITSEFSKAEVIRSLSIIDSAVTSQTTIELAPAKPFALTFSGVTFSPAVDTPWALYIKGLYPSNSSITISGCNFAVQTDAAFTDAPYYAIRSNARLGDFSSLILRENTFNLTSTAEGTNADVRALSFYGSTQLSEIILEKNGVHCTAVSGDSPCELSGFYGGHFGASFVVRDNLVATYGGGYAYGIYSQYDEPIDELEGAEKAERVPSRVATASSGLTKPKWESTPKGKAAMKQMRDEAEAFAPTPVRNHLAISPADAASAIASDDDRRRRFGHSTYVIEDNTFADVDVSILIFDGFAKTVFIRRNVAKCPRRYHQLTVNLHESKYPIHVEIVDNSFESTLRGAFHFAFPRLRRGSSVQIERNYLSSGADVSDEFNPFMYISGAPYDYIGYLTIDAGAALSVSNNAFTSPIKVDPSVSNIAVIGYKILDALTEEPIIYCNNTIFGTKIDTEALFKSSVVWRHAMDRLIEPSKCPKQSPKQSPSSVRLR